MIYTLISLDTGTSHEGLVASVCTGGGAFGTDPELVLFVVIPSKVCRINGFRQRSLQGFIDKNRCSSAQGQQLLCGRACYITTLEVLESLRLVELVLQPALHTLNCPANSTLLDHFSRLGQIPSHLFRIFLVLRPTHWSQQSQHVTPEGQSAGRPYKRGQEHTSLTPMVCFVKYHEIAAAPQQSAVPAAKAPAMYAVWAPPTTPYKSIFAAILSTLQDMNGCDHTAGLGWGHAFPFVAWNCFWAL